jgi:isorenieratene synthase
MTSHTGDSFPVIIIGAGLAGLTAAAHLAARGIPPLVLDPDSLWPGGRLAGGAPDTVEYRGKRWSFDSEHGVHALWGGYANLRATMERFAPIQLQESSGEEWINRWGRTVRVVEAGRMVRFGWLPAPFHYLTLLFNLRFWRAITPLDFLSLPGYLFSTLWAVGFDPIKEGVALDGLMMKEYFRGWTPNLRATFTGLGVNLLAAPAEDISLSAFIAALRFYTILRRDSWQPAFFPENPDKCLIQPLIDAIHASDGQVLQGVEALRLERDGEGWRVIVHDSRYGGQRSARAATVILAANAPGAERLLSNSPGTADAVSQLHIPGTVRNASVRLWFDTSPREGTPTAMFTGDFLPDNGFWLHRLYDDFRAWHAETGGSAIELHLYAGDDILEQPDNVLLIRCVDEMQRAFPELRGHFVQGVVRRNSRVHTRFRVPTRDSLHVQTPFPGLLACGDWIGYPSPAFWMERSCVTAIAAANEVLKANGLEPYPVLTPPQPEGLAHGLEWMVRLFRRTVGRALIAAARALHRVTRH